MIFAFFCLLVLQALWVQSRPATETIPYSEFQTYLKGGRQVKISADQIEGTFKDLLANGTKRFVTNRVEPGLAAELLSQNVTFSSERENRRGPPLCRGLRRLCFCSQHGCSS